MSISGIPVHVRLFVLVFCGMTGLIVWLYGLGFDLVESPAWQVGVYHVILVLLASIPVIVSRSPFWDRGRLKLRPWLVLAALCMPVVVFTLDWVMGGSYAGLRDSRLIVTVSGSVCAIVTVLCIVGLAKVMAFFFAMAFRCMERPVPSAAVLSWLLPVDFLEMGSGQPGDPVEGEVRD